MKTSHPAIGVSRADAVPQFEGDPIYRFQDRIQPHRGQGEARTLNYLDLG